MTTTPLEVRTQRLNTTIEQVTNALDSLQPSRTPSFPERFFREIFLPYFAGDENLPYPVDISTWVARVSGTPHQPVNIVDDATGVVLFQVPPVYDRKAVDPLSLKLDANGRPVGDLASVVAHSQRLVNLSPQQAERYLNAELTQRALIMKVPASTLEFAKSWNAILARYGRPPLVEVGTAAPSAKANATASAEDEYEDL